MSKKANFALSGQIINVILLLQAISSSFFIPIKSSGRPDPNLLHIGTIVKTPR